MRLDVDLQRKISGRVVQQLVQGASASHRSGCRRGRAGEHFADRSTPSGAPSRVMCKSCSAAGRAAGQPSVGGQTGIGLEAIDRTSERRPQGCPRRIRPGLATEAMRVQGGSESPQPSGAIDLWLVPSTLPGDWHPRAAGHAGRTRVAEGVAAPGSLDPGVTLFASPGSSHQPQCERTHCQWANRRGSRFE
jgi:hypothetical protein